jgi:hypothetical protein
LYFSKLTFLFPFPEIAQGGDNSDSDDVVDDNNDNHDNYDNYDNNYYIGGDEDEDEDDEEEDKVEMAPKSPPCCVGCGTASSPAHPPTPAKHTTALPPCTPPHSPAVDQLTAAVGHVNVNAAPLAAVYNFNPTTPTSTVRHLHSPMVIRL